MIIKFPTRRFERYERTCTKWLTYKIQMPVLVRFGRHRITMHMLAHSGTKWNKSYDRRMARWKSLEKKRNTTDNTVLSQTRFRIVTLDCLTKHMLRFNKIRNQILAGCCAYWDHKHVFQFLGFARNQQQFLTAMPKQKYFLWTRV